MPSPAARRLERGDFLTGSYEGKLRRNPGRIQVQLARQGNAWGVPLKITKGVTLEAGSNVAGNRLSDRRLAPRPVAALSRSSSISPGCRPAPTIAIFTTGGAAAATGWASWARGSI